MQTKFLDINNTQLCIIVETRETRWLYCVECPQYSTRRSASNIHRSGMLRKNR